jgi:DNA repair protein RecN (Recombination protein N)
MIMLAALSIRDIVLIEKLDLELSKGLTILTGETGAGKSILLDALGMALGARGDAGLVRNGSEKGSVTASYNLPASHTAVSFLQANEIDVEGDIIVKRVQGSDGASRAFINDQPVSLAVLRQFSALLVELHGQHADRAFVNVSSHRALLDAYGGLEKTVSATADAWSVWSAAREALTQHEDALSRAEVERDYLEHAVKELGALSPEDNEEQLLADKRQFMMQSEQFVGALDEAEQVLGGETAFESRLNAALRRLERKKDVAGGRLDETCMVLDKLLATFGDATSAIDQARRAFAFDPRELEKSEERLFALRAAARKYRCKVDELAAVQTRLLADLQRLEDGSGILAKLQKAEAEARQAYETAADDLSARRKKTAKQLDKAVGAELPALKLEKARFETAIDADASKPSAAGIDRIEFKVATNPGAALSPLMKIASGGELARFMLALKVVLAAKGSAPVLVFDEIDTGVGGAVADAIGKRLRALSGNLQILAVTHSPQVAAQSHQHLLISKSESGKNKRMATQVAPLSETARREELARMLSGDIVTEAARAQAGELMARSA